MEEYKRSEVKEGKEKAGWMSVKAYPYPLHVAERNDNLICESKIEAECSVPSPRRRKGVMN